MSEKKGIHQNFLGRIAYPAHFFKPDQADGGYDLETRSPWPWVRMKEGDIPVVAAKIIAIREKNIDNASIIVVSLESFDGEVRVDVPLSGVKLAPEGSILANKTRIAITPSGNRSNIRQVVNVSGQGMLAECDSVADAMKEIDSRK